MLLVRSVVRAPCSFGGFLCGGPAAERGPVYLKMICVDTEQICSCCIARPLSELDIQETCLLVSLALWK